MKNNKGFTLIELLAVIVVLAVIALITVPLLLNVIDKAKKGAAKASGLGYIDAVEKQVMINQVDTTKTKIQDGTHDVPLTGVTVKGQGPTSGWLAIEKGKVISYSFVIGDYVVTKTETKEETVKGTKAATKPEGGSGTKVCTKVVSTAEDYAIGTEYECIVAEGIKKTFYVLEDGDGETKTDATPAGSVSLIMNQNIDNTTVAYCDQDGANPSNGQLCQADGAKKKLSDTTTQWIKVDKVSLPTGKQIANAVNNTTWTDGGDSISGLPTWLYDYLRNRPNPVANLYGYWTSTPSPNSSDIAWYVYKDGILNGDYVSRGNYFGVRPVITISKSKI